MFLKLIFLVAIVFYVNFVSSQILAGNEEIQETVIRIKGGPLVAELLAVENGFLYKGPVLGFDDTYIFISNPTRSIYPSYRKRGSFSHQNIREDRRVLWAEEQNVKRREKRDFQMIDPSDIPKKRVKRINNFQKEMNNTRNRNQRSIKEYESNDNNNNSINMFNDELWNQEWYLHDKRTSLNSPKVDLNVIPVYQLGITGKGIRISILDDGIEYTHDDLNANFDQEISYNANQENDNILPRMDYWKSNSHGTRCAGEIAMIANNTKCGVGVAFNAKIGGVKMLDGHVTDRIEGTSLSFARDLVDIYSASWGPSDDGITLDGPGRLAKEAFEKGIEYGRNGKGSIYVWASGNGGKKDDNCNCDGYLNSPYTITIGSVSQRGRFPWYGEACASILAVTYSSGGVNKDQMIATTDLNNKCTTNHTGTSAAAPLAAGIIALALEANPSLTWRDIQHLLVWTSEMSPLIQNSGWFQNSVGLWFNRKFGFGLINAFGLVSAAKNWVTVPKYRKCVIKFEKLSDTLTLTSQMSVLMQADARPCGDTENEVNYVEHVEVETSIRYPIRGALGITLMSPDRTRVDILTPRKYDVSRRGFYRWRFLSVLTWGEEATGIWVLTVTANARLNNFIGQVRGATLILSGTKELPAYRYQGERNYNYYYNNVHHRAESSEDDTDYQIYDI